MKIVNFLESFFTLRKFLFLWIILFGVRVVLLAEGTNLSLENVLKHIEIKEDEISNIKFDFIQQVKVKLTEDDFKIKGKVVFQKPRKLYISSKNHTSQKIVCDGEKLWIYLPEYNQVNIEKVESDKFRAGLGGEFLGLGLGKSIRNLVETGDVISFKKEKDCYLLKIASSEAGDFDVTVKVSAHTWLPVEIRVETTETVIVSSILNLKINTKIKQKCFKFKIPEGVSVFEN
ncbi:outer membrane lipoprotein carrier protein LolA [bacterium]|nr:outer membrane lipoprotein carrier protein LolA [bacterium]